MGAGVPSGPFVGRAAEIDALRNLAATAMSTGPAAAVIFATPGIGKSRLLDEVADVLDAPCAHLQGYQTTREVSLGAAGGLLRELVRVPVVGERLDDILVGDAGKVMAAGSVRLFEAAFRCVLGSGPLALVADDLQWMDSATLSLLHYLIVAAGSTGAPLLVLCASRPAPEPAAFASQLAAALPAERFSLIDLGPLEEHEGIDLLGALSPGVTRDEAVKLWRRASGSPFWISALAADLVARHDAHRSPQDLIRDRCANLGTDPATLFSLLLVAAHPLGVRGVAELLGWPDARVSSATLELVNRALVLERNGAVSIAHDLIRETATADLGEDQRLGMHRRLAEWLEASSGDNVVQLLRALEHRVSAGLDGHGLALRIAGSPRRRLVGAEGLAAIGQIADSAGDANTGQLHKQIAALAFEVGDWATSFERWSVIADRAVQRSERCEAALAAAAAALKLGRPFEVHAFAGTARECADVDPVVAIEADCADAQSLLWLESRVPDALPLVERAMTAATSLVEAAGGIRSLDSRSSAAYVRAVRSNLDAAIRRADAVTVRRCAELIQQAAPDPGEALAATSDWVFSMLQFDGIPRSAEPRARRALEESRRLAMPYLEVEATHWMGWIAHHLGRLGEASDRMQRAVALAERVGAPRRFTVPQLRAVLHSIEASRVDWQSNVAAMEPLIDDEPNPHFRLVIRTLHVALVGRFAPSGSHDLGALSARMASDSEVAGCARCHWESVLHYAEAFARDGSLDAAMQAAGSWDAAHPDPPPGGPAARRRYIDALLVAHDDPAGSARLFAEAAQAAEEVGYRLMRLWIDLDGATAAARCDRDRAVDAFERVTLDAGQMGAASELQLAVAALRGLGVRTWRRGPTTSPTALSRREREIAEAVARGASNPEIASALFLSRKTVERHVSHILAKVGARNRAELAAVLARENEGAAG